MTERISAIVSVFNGERYLQEALESVLSQTRPADEIIVVDDGSTDGSADIARAFDRVIVLSQANAGQAAALAAGVARASGTLFAFQDADDLWALDKLERQLAVLADPSVEAVFGMSEQFVSPELEPELHTRFAPPEKILAGEISQAMLVRRSAFERVGGYDPTLRGAGFTDWLARAKRAGLRSVTLPEIVLRRRLHLTNYGRTSVEERNRNMFAALRRNIRRNG